MNFEIFIVTKELYDHLKIGMETKETFIFLQRKAAYKTVVSSSSKNASTYAHNFSTL